MTTEAVRMRDGPSVTDLMTRAAGGDRQAWDALVERYIPLVWSICHGHQLNNADARDVNQTVWQQLAGQLGTPHHPRALTSWLTTTTQRECDQIRRSRRQPGPGQTPDAVHILAGQEFGMAERHAALREAFADLPPHCHQLIAMLTQDPPVPDAGISAKLGIPAPSIRQHCHRCLQQLRRHPAIATLIHTETENEESEASRQAKAL